MNVNTRMCEYEIDYGCEWVCGNEFVSMCEWMFACTIRSICEWICKTNVWLSVRVWVCVKECERAREWRMNVSEWNLCMCNEWVNIRKWEWEIYLCTNLESGGRQGFALGCEDRMDSARFLCARVKVGADLVHPPPHCLQIGRECLWDRLVRHNLSCQAVRPRFLLLFIVELIVGTLWRLRLSWINERVSEWVSECMNEWLNDRNKVQFNGWEWKLQ